MQTCLTCGQTFEVAPATVRAGQGRFCSQACYGAWRSTHAEIGYSRGGGGGKREDLGGLYVRSRWEANYARYLNWLMDQGAIQSWAYEAETFEFPVKRGSKFYTPDFRIVNLDGSVEFHEVKGWMDQQSETRLKRMAKYYPNVRLILVDGPYYKDLVQKVSPLIPGWETVKSHPDYGPRSRKSGDAARQIAEALGVEV